jgi:signal transduction histidine kinase
VAALADRAPIVTTVIADADRRYSAAVESTAYYVVAEALTNAGKHSSAKTIEVRINEVDKTLAVEVVDDGVGGADVQRGSGIIGLKDRVAAAGGNLLIESPPGGGTRVMAELPCE